ncbi:nitrite reductase/ring-hydroxylating ferredoxin subunit [Halohasta litchfieldiae]|jgi:nitrite reductase/ring-hydroxylating ferredoxin subunit|uniref:Ferredoxin subunit of nitrite reductase or a ring-hydroxylating dioxygenase n=1 Tax=Halohasta litchfieldiae TaxID=1073996 RepID=A0A1H6TG99_9EURY|nr:Rieske 2Fe-2S domain-containing protein [Halohasta litchfieldiae]ATW87725.1 nitrite reductase/ring-hydroxylating ferredoxin subunit [Halohasta litchfieldiae]SEI75255.1 Ferredoxin subunit of nitrite reductase or a ring-hydroxylating dioxygenase [Halohasta litchfieldiae]
MSSASRITSVDEVPEETTFLFRVQPVDGDEQKEAILVRDDEGIISWLNYCQHYTHIKLDKGSGAELRNGEVVCTNHGAYFEVDSGRCSFGPCEGAFLNEIDIEVEDGEVYLVDVDYEFVGIGEIETADDDLGSKSNYKF